MKKALALAVVLLLVVGAVGGLGYFEYVVKPQMARQAMAAGGAPPPIPVSAQAAENEPWRSAVPAIGTLQAVQGIAVSSEVAGVVQSLGFDSGQLVQEGTLLVELDIATEEADMKAAQAQFKKSSLDLERQRELLSRGNTTRQSFDNAVAQHESDAAQVERIRALIAEKSILAPFDGRLGLRLVDVGQYVEPGQSLVELIQLDPIYVDFPVPERSVAKIAVGDAVEARLDAFPGQTFPGTVKAVDAQVNAETRSIVVRAELANPDRILLPGMYAEVSVFEPEVRQVVTVPRTAVSFSLYGDYVYVVKPADGAASGGSASGGSASGGGDGQASYTLERRTVTVGEARGDRIAILDGVAAGERVVDAGQNKLRPGQAVTLETQPALQAQSPRPRS